MSRQVKTALSVAVALIALIFGLAISGTLDGLLRTFDSGTGGETSVERQAAAPDNGNGGSAAIAERIVPVFDLVRVEPSGAAVIAGKGEPNATVEILSGEGVVADGKATAEGDWAIVLEDPLAAGAHDIRVRATSPDGASIESEQRVAVSVPAGGQGEVLVVLNEPGAASAVLQLPGAEGGDKPASMTPPPAGTSNGAAASATAQVEPAAGDDVAATPDAAYASAGAQGGPAPSAEATTTTEATTAPAAETALSAASSPETETPGSETGTTETASSPMTVAEASSGPAAGTTTTFVSPAPTEAAPEMPAEAPASAATGMAPDATADAGNETAAAAPEGLAGKPTAPQAGADEQGTDGAATAAPAAATEPAASEARPDGTAEGPSSDAAGGSEVAGPSGTAEPAASETPESASQPSTNEPSTAATAPVAAETAPATAGPAANAPAPVVTVEAVEIENRTMLFAAGAADSGARVRLYIDENAIGDAIAGQGGRWLVQQTIAPLDEGSHRVRADRLGTGGEVVARAEVIFTFVAEAEVAEPQVAEGQASESPAGSGTSDTGEAIGATVAGSGTGAAAAGSGDEGEARIGQPATIIIRPGDNLWTISRRLYGRGVRYSTIYLANTDQIRNPNRIYPGQVFVLPSGDANWPAEPVAAAEPGAPPSE